MTNGRASRIAVIGAGPSGLTAGKTLIQAGYENVVLFEKSDRLGGNWVYTEREGHSSVYETTHVISSKRLSGFSDFPMPASYPDYPSHRQMLHFFEAYASRFDVPRHIRFNAEVTRVRPAAGGQWLVTTSGGATEAFDALFVANGHHWDPRWPNYPGTFAGRYLHSHSYKRSDPFRGLRVLVVGGGNSACDIAVEVGRVGSHSGISWRRGYYVVPKIMLGLPPDVINSYMQWIPRALRRRLQQLSWRVTTGGNAPYGLPKPDHSFLSSHPVVNSELLYALRHGRVTPYPDVDRFDGPDVHFVDGTRAPFDVVIAATGFRISFPFFDPADVDVTDERTPLYLRVFHPDHPSLFFIGLVQPAGCIWPLAEAQSQLVVRYLEGRFRLPGDVRESIRLTTEHDRHRYVSSPRHSIEVDYFDYLGQLGKARRAAG